MIALNQKSRILAVIKWNGFVLTFSLSIEKNSKKICERYTTGRLYMYEAPTFQTLEPQHTAGPGCGLLIGAHISHCWSINFTVLKTNTTFPLATSLAFGLSKHFHSIYRQSILLFLSPHSLKCTIRSCPSSKSRRMQIFIVISDPN